MKVFDMDITRYIGVPKSTIRDWKLIINNNPNNWRAKVYKVLLREAGEIKRKKEIK